jgi:hypothetical protein
MPNFQIARALPAIAPDAGDRWTDIVRWTLEACVQRREGREQSARTILSERLPALIQDWSAVCRLPVEAQKQQLRHLFNQAQTAVETGWFQRRLIVDEIARRLGAAAPATAPSATTPASTGPVQLRRRIPIDDIPAMLDGLADAEDESRRAALLPGRAVVPLSWQALAGARSV